MAEDKKDGFDPLETEPVDTKEEFRKQLLENYEFFPERVQKVLILRFGLMGEDPRTIEEIAEELGISDLRVRQIEHMALNKMFGHMHRSRDILNDFPEK